MSALARPVATVLAALSLTVLNACAVTGYGGGVGVGYDAGYYEPWGYDYGGWGEGYAVGPGYGGWDRGRRGGFEGGRGGDGRGEGHAGRSYRPAPAGRPSPSIPSRSRGGGHR